MMQDTKTIILCSVNRNNHKSIGNKKKKKKKKGEKILHARLILSSPNIHLRNSKKIQKSP